MASLTVTTTDYYDQTGKKSTMPLNATIKDSSKSSKSRLVVTRFKSKHTNIHHKRPCGCCHFVCNQGRL